MTQKAEVLGSEERGETNGMREFNQPEKGQTGESTVSEKANL